MRNLQLSHFVFALVLMSFVMLVTAYTRLAYLSRLPPGMHPDIGYYLSDALRIARSFPDGLFLDDRPEPFWRFYLAFFIRWLDVPALIPTFAGMTVGMFTVALTYRATLELLKLWHWTRSYERYISAALAAAVVSANIVLLFLNREGYRAGLVPLSIAFFIFVLARAWRLGRGWWLAGFASGLPVNTYISGLMAPPAVLSTLVVFSLIRHRTGQQAKRRDLAVLLLWMGIAITPQAILLVSNPAAYTRVSEIDSNQGTPELWQRLENLGSDLITSIKAIYANGNYRPNYSTLETPFLNPVFAGLALVGIFVLILNGRSLPGLLILILAAFMMLPGTLSDEPDHPFRLGGLFVPLAVLTGAGLAGILFMIRKGLPYQKHTPGPLTRTVILGAVLLIPGSIGLTWYRYQTHFQDPKYLPENYEWLSFAHYYSVTWNEYLADLTQIETPVYIPLERLNTSLSAWHLRASAFPTVKTLDSVDVDWSQLPIGDLWYPVRAEYSYPLFPLHDLPEQFALLTPGENGQGGTITILPPMKDETAQALYERVQSAGTPVYAENGWLMSWTLADVSPQTLTQSPQEWFPSGTRFANNSLELIGYEASHDITPGTTWRVTLYWRVLNHVRYDLFQDVTLLDPDLNAIEGRVEWLYRWIYPAVFWQVGDVIPQVVTFHIPTTVKPEAYTLGLKLFTQPNHIVVDATDAAGVPLLDNWLLHQNQRVAQDEAQFTQNDTPLNVVFGDSLRLTGTRSDPLTPGSQVTLTLDWEVLQRPQDNYTQLLHLRDANGNYSVYDQFPLGRRYPTHVWYPGDKIQTTYSFTVPEDSVPPYELSIGWYEHPSLQRLAALQGTETLRDGLLTLPSKYPEE